MKIQNINQNTEWKVYAHTEISYTIREYPDIFLSDNPNLFGKFKSEFRRVIIIDKKVNKLYGKTIQSYFFKHGIKTKIISIPFTEENKTIKTTLKILKELDNSKILRRTEPIIAIGGGTLLDVVGFAANLYRRGVPYLRIPTTLIGLIDAGIGIKTGVNIYGHKNRIGTYYPPQITYIDYSFLKTLDKRNLSNGLAEVLKIALIKDEELFNLLETHATELLNENLQNFSISKVVLNKAIKGMLEELEPNFFEGDLERLVDYGHTVSGVLEMKALPNLLHGEAVCIDMALFTSVAYNRNLITQTTLKRIFNIIKKLNLPIYNKFCTTDILYAALEETMRHRDGFQRQPLPINIGKAIFVNDIKYGEVSKAINLLRTYSV